MSGPFGSSQWMYNAGGGFYDYSIDNSLRFVDFGDNNASNHYLSRTPPSAGSLTTWTWSAWVKRGTNLGTAQHLFSQWEYPPNNQHRMFFGSDDRLTFMLYNGSSNTHLGCKTPEAVLRDVGAWYHIVFVWDTTNGTAADRMRVYINGVRQTTFATTGGAGQSGSIDPSSSQAGYVNTAGLHTIGTFRDPSLYSAFENLDGYMAEINFIDGTALDASSFGETKSGIWIPKEYSGSYGTNGFHLEFSGNANDSSGNANNWTTSGISSHDYMPDSPTNNFAVIRNMNDPRDSGVVFSEGNLKFTTGSGPSARNTNKIGISNILPSSGKWYAEARINNTVTSFTGVGTLQGLISPTSNNTRYAYIYSADGNKYVRTAGSESITSHGASVAVGDVMGIYVDMDALTPEVYFSKNGQWANGSGAWNQSSPTSAITLGDTFFTADTSNQNQVAFHSCSAGAATSAEFIWNFGQDSTFAGSETAGGNTDANGIGDFYSTVPTGALALCSANLPDPAIDPAEDDTPGDYFNTVLWTGTGSGQSITGMGFQPDWLWFKQRNGTSDHALIDSVRGVNQGLVSNSTAAEVTSGASNDLVSFDSDGFTTGTPQNFGSLGSSGLTIATWGWKAGGTGISNTDGSIASTVSVGATSQQNWFSIVGYTGTGANATVGHGLGVAPDLVIVKNRSIVASFLVRSQILATNQTLLLENSTTPISTDYWQSTQPDSSVFSVSSNSEANGSGNNLVAYCFANAEGLCKVGSYVGNSSNDGAFVYTGFRPAWIMIKRTDSSNNWYIFNNKTIPYNSGNAEAIIKANLSDAESDSLKIDFLSSGFKPRDASPGFNTGSYIYLAFAEQPFKYANAR